jgi:hypothetical protein
VKHQKGESVVPKDRACGPKADPDYDMHYVYILESLTVPGHYYIGSTDNLRRRFRQHQTDVDAHAANS